MERVHHELPGKSSPVPMVPLAAAQPLLWAARLPAGLPPSYDFIGRTIWVFCNVPLFMKSNCKKNA